MTRLLAACAALVVAVGAARAADPQPLWEIDTTAEKLRPREVRWVGFSPDDKVLVARVEYIGSTEHLLAWDTKSRKEKFNLAVGVSDRFYYGMLASAMTADGTVLTPADSGKEVRLADGKVRKLTSQQRFPMTSGVWINPETRNAVWFGDIGVDGFNLVVGKLTEFEAEPKKVVAEVWQMLPLRTPKPGYLVHKVAVSPDTKLVAVAAEEDNTRKIPAPHALGLYSLTHGEKPKLTEVAVVPGGHEGAISATMFSPDGKTLATGSRDCSVGLWDISKAGKDWKPREIIPTGQFTVVCLAFSPDGRTLAAGTTDRKGSNLFLIDVAGGKLVSSRAIGEAVTAVAYSADGKLLVTGHNQGKVRVWEAAAVRGD